MLLNYKRAIHASLTQHWREEERKHAESSRRVLTRFERVERDLNARTERQGDVLIAKIKEMFHHGLGMTWGTDQVKVFNAFLCSCLPLIYGSSWDDEKTRVLAEWKLNRHLMYTLVNMARRNGKTYVTAGTTAALLLCIPNVKIAIFSTCKRTSQMMLTAAMDMIERAFDKGTHVQRSDFTVLTRNMESVMFEGPDGTKRLLGSFPGSVRVKFNGCLHTPFPYIHKQKTALIYSKVSMHLFHCVRHTMLLLLALCVGAALGALPHGLTAAEIGGAKKQCQTNCAHISTKGRDLVRHNKCVQECWNAFFHSITEAKQHQPTQVMLHHAPPPPKHPQRTPVAPIKTPFRQMAHPSRALKAALHGRSMRTAGAQLKRMGAVALGVIIMVAVGLML